MAILHIKLLNSKAIGLLRTLHKLHLITIIDEKPNSFADVVKKLRKKKAVITCDEIAREVENVRRHRYSKR